MGFSSLLHAPPSDDSIRPSALKSLDYHSILLFLQIVLEEVYTSLIPHEGGEVSVLVHPKRVFFPNTWITNWPDVDHIGPVFIDVFGVLLVDEVKQDVTIK